MRFRNRLALLLGKAAGWVSRISRMGGGTTLPGRLALLLDPGFVSSMVEGLPEGCVLVTGTNGKTTTASMIASIMEEWGMLPVHNRTGANLMAGIASAILRESDLSGALPGTIGLFEVDEAALPSAINHTRPRLVCVNNLFRDQLDRYGELDTLASLMGRAIADLDDSSTVVLNADDPLVASIGRGLKQEVVYFGIDSARYAMDSMQHAADSKHCPDCGMHLDYEHYIFGHMGDYSCPGCGRKRPVPQVSAYDLFSRGMEGTGVNVRYPGGEAVVEVPLPGLYNVYNVLASLACTLSLGIEPGAAVSAIERFTAAFGRVEEIEAGERRILMVLAKNPAGYNEVIRTLSSTGRPKTVLLALNDNIADGRDVSWIWDVDLEMFAGHLETVVCSGTRAWDMALRVKYAETGEQSVLVEPDLEKALDSGLSMLPAGETLYAVPTYTAMLDLRSLLVKRKLASPYWERP